MYLQKKEESRKRKKNYYFVILNDINEKSSFLFYVEKHTAYYVCYIYLNINDNHHFFNITIGGIFFDALIYVN